MAFEAVDACFGTPHIGSDDLAALNTAMVGKSDCVMEWGDDLKLTMSSANTAVIGKGVGRVGGRRFWNDAAQALFVQSGTQGQKRNDLVVARYAKTSAGIESITPVVVRGANTTGTPDDPAVTANDLKLWRIPINGITVGTPVRLFTPVTPLATLGDSVSPRGIIDVNKTGIAYGDVWAEAYGNVVVVHVAAVGPSSNHGAWTAWKFGQLPVGYRPQRPVTAAVYSRPGAALIQANSDGSLYFTVRDNAMQTGQNLDGTLTFVRA